MILNKDHALELVGLAAQEYVNLLDETSRARKKLASACVDAVDFKASQQQMVDRMLESVDDKEWEISRQRVGQLIEGHNETN